jgi:hypothetical protein
VDSKDTKFLMEKADNYRKELMKHRAIPPEPEKVPSHRCKNVGQHRGAA